MTSAATTTTAAPARQPITMPLTPQPRPEAAAGAEGGGAGPYDVVMYRESQTDSDILKVRSYLDEIVLGTGYAHLLKVAAA